VRAPTFGESETRRVIGYDVARSRAPLRMIAVHFSLLAVADGSGPAPPKLGWPASWPCSTGGRPDTNDRLQFEQGASVTSTGASIGMGPIRGTGRASAHRLRGRLDHGRTQTPQGTRLNQRGRRRVGCQTPTFHTIAVVASPTLALIASVARTQSICYTRFNRLQICTSQRRLLA